MTTRPFIRKLISGAGATLLGLCAAQAQDTNSISRILQIYGGFEQAEMEGWQPADARVPIKLSKEEPAEGSQCVEIILPKESPVYYSPGIEINPHWRWNCAKPAVLRFSVNARERYLGYNLYARLDGVSDQGGGFTFVFFAMQTGPHWTHCKEGKAVWNPTPDFGKGIGGFEAFKSQKSPFYCAWLPGLSAGEWLPVMKKWAPFEASLDDAFKAPEAPVRPKHIDIKTLKIMGYLSDQTHYWIDGVSLGEK